MANEIKRLTYFNGQFLREPDFLLEQNYHIQHQRDHMRLLHTPGIAEGLEVGFVAGATAVTVKPGVAYDRHGQRISLTKDVPIELSDESPGQEFFITISYREQRLQADQVDETGISGIARVTEDPAVEKSIEQPADTNEKLVLAKVKRSGTVVSGLDRTLRRTAGLKADAAEVTSLTLRSDTVDPSKWVKITLVGAGERLGLAKIDGDLHLTGRLFGPGLGGPNPPVVTSAAGDAVKGDTNAAPLKNKRHEDVAQIDAQRGADQAGAGVINAARIDAATKSTSVFVQGSVTIPASGSQLIAIANQDLTDKLISCCGKAAVFHRELVPGFSSSGDPATGRWEHLEPVYLLGVAGSQEELLIAQCIDSDGHEDVRIDMNLKFGAEVTAVRILAPRGRLVTYGLLFTWQ